MRFSVRPLGLACLYLALGCPSKDELEPDATDAGTVGGSESGATEPPVDSESGDMPDPPAECSIDSQDKSVFVAVGEEAIDEVCSVVTSMKAGQQLSLSFDCPEAGARSVVLATGPLPGVIPQVGDLLAVYYRSGDFQGTLGFASPELLFLRSEESLVYASIRGYFLGGYDRVQEKAQPLGIQMVEGTCPSLATGWEGGDGPNCELQAVAQIQLSGDVETLVSEGETTSVMAGSDAFWVDLRVARRGAQCVEDVQIDYVTLAIARQ